MLGHDIFRPPVQTSSPGAASGWASAESAARRAANDVNHVEDRLERLTLLTMAMWSLIQDQTDLTEKDLMQRVETLDLMDGKADGKATRTVQHCHACSRPLNAKHRRCLYCGEPMRTGSAFDAV